MAPSQAPASPSPWHLGVPGDCELPGLQAGAHLRKRGLIPSPRGCDTGGWRQCLMARKTSLRTPHSQGLSRGHSHPHSDLWWIQPRSHGYLCMEDFSLSSTVSALKFPLSHV